MEDVKKNMGQMLEKVERSQHGNTFNNNNKYGPHHQFTILHMI
jgi:hypothetical protein